MLLWFQTELPLRVTIDVPSSAIKTDEIEDLFKNLSEEMEVLCIVRIFNSIIKYITSNVNN